MTSLIEPVVPRYGAGLHVGRMEGAGDPGLLAAHGITTVVNCAVNLDIGYVAAPFPEADSRVDAAPYAARWIAMVDGDAKV